MKITETESRRAEAREQGKQKTRIQKKQRFWDRKVNGRILRSNSPRLPPSRSLRTHYLRVSYQQIRCYKEQSKVIKQLCKIRLPYRCIDLTTQIATLLTKCCTPSTAHSVAVVRLWQQQHNRAVHCPWIQPQPFQLLGQWSFDRFITQELGRLRTINAVSYQVFLSLVRCHQLTDSIVTSLLQGGRGSGRHRAVMHRSSYKLWQRKIDWLIAART